MKDEIKEILDRLDFNEWEVDLYKVPITWTELYDIRDYITNLQEELKYQKQAEQEYNEKHTKLMKKYKELQERIDKAIEYIKNHKETRKHYEPYGTPMGNPSYTTTHIFGYYELLNILNGDDE